MSSQSAASGSRLLSLDVFRGATIAGMMLVNNPGTWGAIYPQLSHAAWHGWTYTDTIFPFFLWIVGVAMTLSFAKRIERGDDKKKLFLHVLQRAAVIFALGLFLASFVSLFLAWVAVFFLYWGIGRLFASAHPVANRAGAWAVSILFVAVVGYWSLKWTGGLDYTFTDLWNGMTGSVPWLNGLLKPQALDTIRIPGVLQRIAVCYIVASALFLWLDLKWQIVATAALMYIYWLFMMLYPVPGYAPGTLEPIGNFSQYLDSLLLNGHMWSVSKVWDPEGVWSTLPAIGSTMLGVFTGILLRAKMEPAEKTSWMFTIGLVMMFIAAWWDMAIPINKNIWTPSYTLLMAGMSSAVFALLYWVVDRQGWKKWSYPMEVFGMNAIAVFVLSGVLGRLVTLIKVAAPDGREITLKGYLFQYWFTPLGAPVDASLYFAMAWLLMLYAIAWVMYKRKWFLKV